jgi:hypothetical protein
LLKPEGATEDEQEPDDSDEEIEQIIPWDLAALKWDEAKDRAARHVEPREGREWISVGVVAAGIGLIASGGWPRRRRVGSA